MNKLPECIEPLKRAGIKETDAFALRRIAMALHRWHELECGVDAGAVERDEVTGKVTLYSQVTGRRTPYPDRETSQLKRLAKIMASYPGFEYYVQGDPRGASLYIVPPHEVKRRHEIKCNLDACYSSVGVAVYK